jgi:hypothetical protein
MPRSLPFFPSPPGLGSGAVFYAPASDAGIRGAYIAAVAAGGGTIILPPRTITLTSPLPWSSGIFYQGTGWAPTQYLNDGGTYTYSGTILQGDGTFRAVAYNAADQITAPASYANWINGMAKGGGFESLTFYNFTDGIKVGALYNPGCQFSTFRRLNFDTCSGTSFYIENSQCEVIDDINIIRPGTGTITIGTSGAAIDFTGNCTVSNVIFLKTLLTTRGMYLFARDDGSNTNPTRLNSVVVHGYNTLQQHIAALDEISQTITTTSGSPNIGVTDSTKFLVDMPVTFDSTAKGFTANQIYFVVSSGSNTLTLSNTQRGATINATVSTASATATFSSGVINIAVPDETKFPTGSSVVLSANVGTLFTAGTQYWVTLTDPSHVIRLAAGSYLNPPITPDGNGTPTISTWPQNIKTKGFSVLEMVGYGSSIIEGCSATQLDIEGRQSTHAVLQNGQGTAIKALYVDTVNSYRTCTLRNSQYCEVNFGFPYTYDLDNLSISSVLTGAVSEIIPTVGLFSGATSAGVGSRVNAQSGTIVNQNSLAYFIAGFNKPDIYQNSSTFALQFQNSMDTRATMTSPYAVLVGDSGKQFDNIGASGEVDFTLPSCTAAMAGMKFGFYVGAAQTLKVIAPASTTIRIAGSVSAAAGNITNATIGSYVELTAVAANTYVAKLAPAGTWVVT